MLHLSVVFDNLQALKYVERNRTCVKCILQFVRSLKLYGCYNIGGCTRWCSWSRNCSTILKIPGLIPDGLIGIIHWLNPSGPAVTLVSTKPLAEVSTRDLS
jgi:hypothetical protein